MTSYACEIELQQFPQIIPPNAPKMNEKKPRGKTRVSQLIDFNGSSSFIRKVGAFFSPIERAAWIAFAEDKGMERCMQRATRDCAHRQQYRMSFQDEGIASMIFNRVLPFLPPECDKAKPHSCSSNIRIYRYDVGDSFGAHYDDTNSIKIPLLESADTKRASKNRNNLAGWTKLTILIYLNGDDYPVEGGETIFYKEDARVRDIFVSFSPTDCSGDLLMHGHGHRCLLHEARPVTYGKKYMLRTDVVYA